MRGNIRHLNKSENNDTATASSTFFSGLYNDNLFRTGLTNVENRRNSFFNLLRMAIPDGYSGLCQISRMEYFSKSSTLDTWQGSEYAPLFSLWTPTWKKNLYGPFYGWGLTASSWLQPLQGGSLLFTIKFPEIPGTHFIDLARMTAWVELGATQWHWKRDSWIGNPATWPLGHCSIKTFSMYCCI